MNKKLIWEVERAFVLNRDLTVDEIINKHRFFKAEEIQKIFAKINPHLKSFTWDVDPEGVIYKKFRVGPKAPLRLQVYESRDVLSRLLQTKSGESAIWRNYKIRVRDRIAIRRVAVCEAH